MSPLLFGVYMDGLLNKLKEQGIGCYMGQQFCGAAGYADDMILLCPTSAGLRKMIDIREQYPNVHDILFNATKSKILIYNKRDADPHFKVNGVEVPLHNKATCLGTVLNIANATDVVLDSIQKFNSCVNRFMSEFGCLQTIVKNKLYHQYCCALYGSQLWPLWHENINNLCRKWRNAMRKIWKLPHDSHSDLVPLVAECTPLDIALDIRFITFYRNVISLNNTVVNYIAKASSVSCSSVMGKNVRYVMSKYNLTHGELVDLPKAYMKQRCNDIRKNEINVEYFDYANIIRDLVNMKDLCYDTIFTQEECNEIIECISTSRN